MLQFMERVETPDGEGLVIGMTADRLGVNVAVRQDGEKGAGRNRMYGWCEAHGTHAWGEACPECQRIDG